MDDYEPDTEEQDEDVAVELSDAVRAAAIIYQETRVQIADLEDRAKQARDTILDFLGQQGANQGLVRGVKVLTGHRKVRRYFDTTKFKRDNPGTYASYMRDGSVVPFLRIGNAKKLIVG